MSRWMALVIREHPNHSGSLMIPNPMMGGAGGGGGGAGGPLSHCRIIAKGCICSSRMVDGSHHPTNVATPSRQAATPRRAMGLEPFPLKWLVIYRIIWSSLDPGEDPATAPMSH